MTLFDLIIRSMRKNVKHYYLYFFALIFSTGLYFVFSTLQYDEATLKVMASDASFNTAFKVAGMLLLFIVVVFAFYANQIFLKRRSKEIGVYQLIGLTRKAVARLLVIENILLGLGALLLGICGGALIARLFLIILLKLIGFAGMVNISFSIEAAIQTIIIFSLLIVLTSIQIVRTVYNHTLLELFRADQQAEHPREKNSIISAIIAVMGISLIVYGYSLSGRMTEDTLLLDMLLVLGSTILGTYLLFRVTISWLFCTIRKNKDGHLGLKNSVSLAPLMHRMKANANSLTLITILSAMTLTMVAVSYSLYYSAKADTRAQMPYDFIFENNPQAAKSFSKELEKADISFVYQPIETVKLLGKVGSEDGKDSMLLLPAEQLRQSGIDVILPDQGQAIHYDAHANMNLDSDKQTYPGTVEIEHIGGTTTLELTQLVVKNAINFNVHGNQYVVSESLMNDLKEKLPRADFNEVIVLDTYQIANEQARAKAAELYEKYISEGEYMPNFHTEYKGYLQLFGIFIFIAAFLGLVFLIATGSILYFKQMTEAEQEKQSYKTLRQLGFDVKDIMGGIIRKQLFVFAIPLAIGLLHSIFAVKAAKVLLISDITVPSAIAMGAYIFIYFLFAVLTINYYKRIVKGALKS